MGRGLGFTLQALYHGESASPLGGVPLRVLGVLGVLDFWRAEKASKYRASEKKNHNRLTLLPQQTYPFATTGLPFCHNRLTLFSHKTMSMLMCVCWYVYAVAPIELTPFFT